MRSAESGLACILNTAFSILIILKRSPAILMIESFCEVSCENRTRGIQKAKTEMNIFIRNYFKDLWANVYAYRFRGCRKRQRHTKVKHFTRRNSNCLFLFLAFL